MTILAIEQTIARLREGYLEAVLHNDRKGARLPGPLQHVPLNAKHVNTLLRCTLTASPGNLLVVADFSQVEARNLAWAADDHDALARFAVYDSGDHDNGDPYAAMAAKIFGGMPRDYVKGSAGEYPGRHIGKQAELGCFVSATPVLTHTGFKAIAEVTTDDLLWDGYEWVTHHGVIDQGDRETIDLAGVGVTPDHEIWTGRRWARAASLVQSGATLCLALDAASGGSWSSTPTDAPRVDCNVRSPNSRRVYDIAGAGPRRRFTILTERGPLIVHNCGYGMGEAKFHQKVIDDGGSWPDIIEAAGLTGQIDAEDMASSVVKAWRELHHPIVCFWKELQAAAVEVTEGGAGSSCAAGPYTWHNIDGLVLCELPSGRSICYRGMRCDWEESNFGGRPRPSLSYIGREGRDRTYGGKLAENVTQASCRDLLAESLVRAEQAGLRPVHTIHDEIICDVPEADADDAAVYLEELMCVVPAWARGMPIAAERLRPSYRYGK